MYNNRTSIDSYNFCQSKSPKFIKQISFTRCATTPSWSRRSACWAPVSRRLRCKRATQRWRRTWIDARARRLGPGRFFGTTLVDQNAGKHIINGWKTHHQWLENTSLMRVLDKNNMDWTDWTMICLVEVERMVFWAGKGCGFSCNEMIGDFAGKRVL